MSCVEITSKSNQSWMKIVRAESFNSFLLFSKSILVVPKVTFASVLCGKRHTTIDHWVPTYLVAHKRYLIWLRSLFCQVLNHLRWKGYFTMNWSMSVYAKWSLTFARWNISWIYPHGADWLATLPLTTDTNAVLHTFAFLHQPTALSRCGKQMMTIYDFYPNVDSTTNFNPGVFFHGLRVYSF